MFSHVMIGTNDLEKAKSFYDALLGTLDVPPGTGRPPPDFLPHQDRHFLGDRCRSTARRRRRPMAAPSVSPRPQEADAWHATGLAHGGDLRGTAGHPRSRGPSSIWPICATLTATSSAPFTGSRRTGRARIGEEKTHAYCGCRRRRGRRGIWRGAGQGGRRRHLPRARRPSRRHEERRIEGRGPAAATPMWCRRKPPTIRPRSARSISCCFASSCGTSKAPACASSR